MNLARSALALLAALMLGAATPTGQLYSVDGAASSLSAKVPFFGIGSRSAGFPAVSGSIRLDHAHPKEISLDVTIDARALTAPDKLTLSRLRGEKFFWVEKYPAVRFVGREISFTSPTTGNVNGELTARGVTQPVTLQVAFDHPPMQSLPGEAITLTGETKINRYDFEMKSYRLIVGKWVNIQLKARLVPQA